MNSPRAVIERRLDELPGDLGGTAAIARDPSVRMEPDRPTENFGPGVKDFFDEVSAVGFELIYKKTVQ